jgi:bacterioferritin-associated ferredoxin
MRNNKKNSPIICRCNNVSRGTIEQAIRDGCDTMNKLFDATTAGVGPCGGSCRRKLLPMLEHYQKTGTFPEKIVEDMTGKSGAPASETSPGSTGSSETPARPAGSKEDK